jgi:hypothetical protein
MTELTREQKLEEIAAIVWEYDPEYGLSSGDTAKLIMEFLETGVSPLKQREPISPLKLQDFTKEIMREYVAGNNLFVARGDD